MIIQSTSRIESWTLVLSNKGMYGLLLDRGMELCHLQARYAVKGFSPMLERLIIRRVNSCEKLLKMRKKIPVGPIPIILIIYHIIKNTKKRGLMNEKILTPAEVAERLQISMAKAYSLLKSGEIDVMRIGSLVRVKDEDLERYIEARTQARGPAR